jgi:hypothetical protein
MESYIWAVVFIICRADYGCRVADEAPLLEPGVTREDCETVRSMIEHKAILGKGETIRSECRRVPNRWEGTSL